MKNLAIGVKAVYRIGVNIMQKLLFFMLVFVGVGKLVASDKQGEWVLVLPERIAKADSNQEIKFEGSDYSKQDQKRDELASQQHKVKPVQETVKISKQSTEENQ